MSGLIDTIFKQYGGRAILYAIVGAICIWGLAHWFAAPGSEVSILWGLAKYYKRPAATVVAEPVGREPVRREPEAAPPAVTGQDVDSIASIRGEVPDLLQRTKSAPGGLWLAARAVTGGREDLVEASTQIKREHRAEALAHLAYTLSVLQRPDDARHIAELSLAAISDMHEGMRLFSLADLAETFAKAELTANALQAAEQSLALARRSGETDGLTRLVRVLVRISSPGHARDAAGDIDDLKARNEAQTAIVDELIRDGRQREAGEAFEEALATARRIPSTSDRASALADRARELARLGRFDESSSLAIEATREALEIPPEELFGELTTKMITSEMGLLERRPEEIVRLADRHQNAQVLVRYVRYMPRGSREQEQVTNTALTIATNRRDPVVLSEIAQFLQYRDQPDDAVRAAERATEMALRSGDAASRRGTLRRTAEILARTGDLDAAIEAAQGIDDVEASAKLMAEILTRAYAEQESVDGEVNKILARVHGAAASLEDRDRSKVMMYLAIGQALLGDSGEAYSIARSCPLSGHRLAAYSVILLVYESQLAPDTRDLFGDGTGEPLMGVLEPIFAFWGLD